jgi:DNA-binding IclR family transcriptional regulator
MPMKNSQAKTQRGIQSVEVAGRLLKGLAEARHTMALTDLAASAELSAPQAHAYLVSLSRWGLIKRTPIDGKYEPGPLALRLGMARLTQTPAYRVAVPQVQKLSGSIGCSVALSLPTVQGPTIVHYAHVGSPLHINLHVGTVMALAGSATGRTFCAFQPKSAWYPLWTAHVTNPSPEKLEEFEQEIQAIRRRGMDRAIDNPTPGVSALVMPLLGKHQELLLLLTAVGATGSIDVGWKGAVSRAMKQCIHDLENLFLDSN